jgi:hypothetical protein
MTAKAPDNQPFDWNMDAFVAGLDHQPFRFPFKGERWEMKHFDALDSKETSAAMETGDDRALIKLAMGGDQFAKFDEIKLSNGAQRELVVRYFKHCGVDLGKLPGSTDS